MHAISNIDLFRIDEHYKVAFSRFMELGSILGFTTEEIEEAYYSKNKINHERQENDYWKKGVTTFLPLSNTRKYA